MIPFPDVNSMTADQVIRWMVIALMVFLIGFMYGELQARAREHQQLLMVGQVQCLNDAERVIVAEVRSKQVRRCLTLKLDVDQPE